MLITAKLRPRVGTVLSLAYVRRTKKGKEYRVPLPRKSHQICPFQYPAHYEQRGQGNVQRCAHNL